MPITVISPQDLAALQRQGHAIHLIDVRTPAEFAAHHVEFAENRPLDSLDAKEFQAHDAGTKEPLYVICRSGLRSMQACKQLRQAGLVKLVNVSGGTLACGKAGLPMVHGPKRDLAGAVLSWLGVAGGGA